MAYVNNLLSYTSLTTPATPYAPPPAVVCDFGWYSTQRGTIYGNLIYDVAGNTYPPPPGNDVRADYNLNVKDYVTFPNDEVTFDCYDSENLQLPTLIVPQGITIISYNWDFGNGFTAQGSVASTIYQQATPDGACTLTVTDNLGRITRTTKRLNFISGVPGVGALNRFIGAGTGGGGGGSTSGGRGAFVYDAGFTDGA